MVTSWQYIVIVNVSTRLYCQHSICQLYIVVRKRKNGDSRGSLVLVREGFLQRLSLALEYNAVHMNVEHVRQESEPI